MLYFYRGRKRERKRERGERIYFPGKTKIYTIGKKDVRTVVEVNYS